MNDKGNQFVCVFSRFCLGKKFDLFCYYCKNLIAFNFIFNKKKYESF